MVDEWKRSLADAQDAHEKELSTLRSNLAAMERAETELRDNLKRVSEESTAELEACEQRYDEKTSSLEEKHDAERAELEDKLASTLRRRSSLSVPASRMRQTRFRKGTKRRLRLSRSANVPSSEKVTRRTRAY